MMPQSNREEPIPSLEGDRERPVCPRQVRWKTVCACSAWMALLGLERAGMRKWDACTFEHNRLDCCGPYPKYLSAGPVSEPRCGVTSTDWRPRGVSPKSASTGLPAREQSRDADRRVWLPAAFRSGRS